MNVDTFSIRKIRMSDAVLLSMISDVPLYIDGALMEQQSIPFQEANTRVSIPINTLDIDKLKEALDKAVDEENYRLASVIKDELGRREKAKREGRI
jgi:bifunctional DNase/RNase